LKNNYTAIHYRAHTKVWFISAKSLVPPLLCVIISLPINNNLVCAIWSQFDTKLTYFLDFMILHIASCGSKLVGDSEEESNDAIYPLY